MKGLFIFSIMSILLSSCEKDFSGIKNPAETKGTIYGKVLDQASQQPVAGAVVLAVHNKISDTTNSSGDFMLRGLEPGREIILISAASYYPFSKSVQVNVGTQQVQLIMNCDPTLLMDTTHIYYYYYQNQPLYLTLATDLLGAEFDSTLSTQTIDRLVSHYNLTKLVRANQWFLLKAPPGRRAEEFFTFYGVNTSCGFGNQDFLLYATPAFWLYPGVDSSVIVLNDNFAAKIDTNETNFEHLEKINTRHHVEFVDEDPIFSNWYLLRVTKQSDLNAMDMANLYQDSSYVEIAAPDFRGLIGPP